MKVIFLTTELNFFLQNEERLSMVSCYLKMQKYFKLKILTLTNPSIKSPSFKLQELITTFVSSHLLHHLWNCHFLINHAPNLCLFFILLLVGTLINQSQVDFSFSLCEFTNHFVVFLKLQSSSP